MLTIAPTWSVTSSDLKNVQFFCMIYVYTDSENTV